jgi:hypothetical protein
MSAWLLCDIGAARAQGQTGAASPPTTGGSAPPPFVPNGFHQHDGPWMRLQLGYGYLSGSISNAQDGIHESFSGDGLTFAAAFGSVVRRNLVVYGELLLTHIANKQDPPPAFNEDDLSADLTMLGVGPGLAYYLDPYDVYLSTSLAFTSIIRTPLGHLIPSNGNSIASYGIGVNFMVGKEWWLSADWGLGLAAQARFAGTGEHGSFETTVSASAYSLLVSSTFN